MLGSNSDSKLFCSNSVHVSLLQIQNACFYLGFDWLVAVWGCGIGSLGRLGALLVVVDSWLCWVCGCRWPISPIPESFELTGFILMSLRPEEASRSLEDDPLLNSSGWLVAWNHIEKEVWNHREREAWNHRERDTWRAQRLSTVSTMYEIFFFFQYFWLAVFLKK